MDGGINDEAIAESLQAMAQANTTLQANQNNQKGGADKFYGLGKFERNNPPTIKGRYDLEVAQIWLRDIENIFWVMACTDAQKVLLGTHMLSKEVKFWWNNAR